MRAAVLTDTETLEIEERQRPTPAADEVLVRMGAVGICGSDVHYYEHGRIGDYVVDGPLVLGHESAGEIVDVGDDVDEHAVGDRVALEPGVPCRRCQYCREGRYHLCDALTFMATPPDDGAFAEYVAWPADYAFSLPDDVTLREGALCEPLAVGIHATRLADVRVGDSVLVTGAGPIGLLALEVVRAAGATEVFVSDLVSRKLELAADRGADATIDVGDSDQVEWVDAATDGAGVDVVIEASGAPPVYEQALDAVAPGGTIVCTGLAQTDAVSIDVVQLTLEEVTMQGAIRYSNAYLPAVSMLANGDVDVAGIVNAEYDLANVDEAFERTRDPEVVKTMVKM